MMVNDLLAIFTLEFSAVVVQHLYNILVRVDYVNILSLINIFNCTLSEVDQN